MKKRFYITTTIPYVNAAPHIGHALEFVQADAIARARRVAGDEVYFLSGTDDNAMKNVQAAEQAGVPVDEFVAKNSSIFEELLRALNISIDQFICTAEERHRKGAQALWTATDPDDIYKKKYSGLYCAGCELFYQPEELDEHGECFEHPGRKPEIVEEENYFFRLSKYGDWLRGIISSGELSIVPESRKNEALALIDRGLEDFSISRPVSRSKGWGVLVPGDDQHTMYVWYDALANYITALGYPDTKNSLYQKFWEENPNRFHILGKGVGRFHAIYWPAMLKSAGLPIPTQEFIHGYVSVNGQKMSKTLGNVIDPFSMVQKYGVDAVRYYLLREIVSYGDGDFSEEKFRVRYNADLANGLGNFISRTYKLAHQFRAENHERVVEDEVLHKADAVEQLVAEKVAQCKFNEATEVVMELVSFGDGYLAEHKPWLRDLAFASTKVWNAIFIAKRISELLRPFLPGTAEKIVEAINTMENPTYEEGNFGNPKVPLVPLFPRLS